MRIDEVKVGDRIIVNGLVETYQCGTYGVDTSGDDSGIAVDDGYHAVALVDDVATVVSIDPVYDDVVVVVRFDDGLFGNFLSGELPLLTI